MRLSIIGSRTFNDYFLLKEILDPYTECISLVVSGGAKGADTLGEKWAKDNNIPTLIFKPDWEKYGKRAGWVRNVDIIDNCDGVLAFWDGISKGTNHSIELAKEKNKMLRIVKI